MHINPREEHDIGGDDGSYFFLNHTIKHKKDV
jgi:hypothetical protein